MNATDIWQRIWQRITDWFLVPQARPSASYRVLRWTAGLVLLARAWADSKTLLDTYGNGGLLPWWVGELSASAFTFRLSWLQRLGLSQNHAVVLVFTVYVAAVVVLIIGWRPRTAAVTAALTYWTLTSSNSLSLYGVDVFAAMALFYLVAAPAAVTGGRAAAGGLAVGCWLRMLQVHVCVVYLNAGIAKGLGTQWWNGEAIWRAVMQPQFAVVDLAWLSTIPLAAKLLGWSTLLVETGYPLAIWTPRLRRPWLVMTIGMHLFIALGMGLTLFAAMMIAFNLAAFGAEEVAGAVDGLRRRLGSLAQRARHAITARAS